MTFLNPTALFALFAAGLPVIIHFLNLKKLKKTKFSSIAFIKDLQKTKIKRIKIKQWLLLLIRTLIIIFLVFAFSKPAIRPLGGFSSGAKTTAVIIIDNSFSMSIIDSDGSYFNQAKQAALNLLNSLNQGDEAAVIFTGGKEEQNTGAITDFYKVKNIIENGKINPAHTPLAVSMIKAKNILALSDNANREVYILSDFQKSSSVPPNDFKIDGGGIYNGFTRIYLLQMPERKVFNLSITGLGANNQIFEPGRMVSFTADVSNYTKNRYDNAVVSLFVNGKRTAQQGVNLNGGETKQIRFETALNETGLLNISAELEDDDILYDNKRYISLYVPEKINAAAFTDNADDLKYIRFVTETFPPDRIAVKEYNALSLNTAGLSKYDIIILCASENISGYDALKNYLLEGGNILFFPGGKTTRAGYNKFCSGLNIAGAEKLFQGINAASSPAFDKIDLQHPVLNALFEKEKGNNISSPAISSYFKINPAGGKSLIGLTGGSSFLTEYKLGRGRIMQFAVSPVDSWGDFPLKPVFAPLIQKSILYLSAKVPDSGSILAGEPLIINKNALLNHITAELPGGDKIIINDTLKENSSAVFGETGQAGIYKFYGDGKLIDFSSVNFDWKESVLERIQMTEFEAQMKKRMINSSFKILDIKKDIKKEIENSRLGIELWKYFLIAALLLAAAEMYIARTSKNEFAETNLS